MVQSDFFFFSRSCWADVKHWMNHLHYQHTCGRHFDIFEESSGAWIRAHPYPKHPSGAFWIWLEWIGFWCPRRLERSSSESSCMLSMLMGLKTTSNQPWEAEWDGVKWKEMSMCEGWNVMMRWVGCHEMRDWLNGFDQVGWLETESRGGSGFEVNENLFPPHDPKVGSHHPGNRFKNSMAEDELKMCFWVDW